MPSVGIIMDGNRRWAKERGVSSLDGHRAGMDKISEVLTWAQRARVEELTLYAFSTENWKRSPDEVAYLMHLFEEAFAEKLDPFIERGGRVRFIGDRVRIPERLKRLMESAEERSAQGSSGTLVIALSYGGRAEIVDAVSRLLKAGATDVTEESLRNEMWSAGLSDPDIIIRTGGERRLSNFLTWQSTYSELFFVDTKWPDLSPEELDRLLAEYVGRERRRGA